MCYFVYILKSLKDGRYYIGSTSDVEKRLVKHNSGGNISTKNRRPLVVVYREKFSDKILALKREKEIKSYKGGLLFKRLLDIME
jgi:putative endonuclease